MTPIKIGRRPFPASLLLGATAMNVWYSGNSGPGAGNPLLRLLTQMYGPAVRSKKISTSWR